MLIGVSPEQEVQIIVDKAASIQRLPTPKRGPTLELRELLNNPKATVFTGADQVVAEACSQALQFLRTQDGVYSELGRVDITEGLAQVASPLTQVVVAEGLLDPSPMVVKAAERILLDPKRKIYPDTITYLFDEGHEELGLTIMERNSSVWGTFPVDGVLERMVMEGLEEVEGMEMEERARRVERARRAACLTGILYQRTHAVTTTLVDASKRFLLSSLT